MTCACLKKFFEGSGKFFIALLLTGVLLIISLLFFVKFYLELPPQTQDAIKACGLAKPLKDQSTQDPLSHNPIAIQKRISYLEERISDTEKVVACLQDQVNFLQKKHEAQSFWHKFWYILGAIIFLVLAWLSAIFFSTFAKAISEKVSDKIK